MITAQSILNYYLSNPPFEITDKIKYAEFLQFQSEMTMVELSENNPATSEATFTTAAAAGDEEYIRHDMTEINENLMELLILDTTASLADSFSAAFRMYSSYGSYLNAPSTAAVNAAVKSHSLMNILAVSEYQNIIEEWYAVKIKKVVFDGKFIKLLPSTEYYSMFSRYKNVTELQQSEMRTFQRLVNMNIMLAIYQSDTFASEGGIRSVSLSGLSVSFNVPEAAGKVRDLQRAKTELLSSIALDYGDGCVGLI